MENILLTDGDILRLYPRISLHFRTTQLAEGGDGFRDGMTFTKIQMSDMDVSFAAAAASTD